MIGVYPLPTVIRTIDYHFFYKILHSFLILSYPFYPPHTPPYPSLTLYHLPLTRYHPPLTLYHSRLTLPTFVSPFLILISPHLTPFSPGTLNTEAAASSSSSGMLTGIGDPSQCMVSGARAGAWPPLGWPATNAPGRSAAVGGRAAGGTAGPSADQCYCDAELGYSVEHGYWTRSDPSAGYVPRWNQCSTPPPGP